MTEARLAANRANAQKSTGPRTEAGKSVSRMNALKSGLHAQSHIIRGEDPEALARLAAEYNAEFHPVTPRQRDLVDTLVDNEWKIRRLRAIETDLWALQFEYNDAMFGEPDRASHKLGRRHALATAYDDLEKRLESLQRRLHAYERSTTRALRQLDELRNSETAPSPEPIDSTASAPIGFLPPNPEAPAPEDRAKPSPEPLPSSPPNGFVPQQTSISTLKYSLDNYVHRDDT
jgi:hypothetical protein